MPKNGLIDVGFYASTLWHLTFLVQIMSYGFMQTGASLQMLFVNVVNWSGDEQVQPGRGLHKANKSRKGRKRGDAVEHCMKYFHCHLCSTGLRCALCEAFLAFSETSRAPVKVPGEMSTTDTVVPTRSAF